MSDELREVPVSGLQVSNVGGRIVTIDNSGNAFDGVLDGITTSSWEYGKVPEEMIRTSLKVKAGSSELTLRNLPLNFRVQVAVVGIEGERT